ncbi:hypothetical protein LTR78_004021 [Recurvomyces mirabilis]|uniref:Opioid growth factor receptor (OGFr) conserved domain-containing protein n=1 Tax=Recurvomyces mirabilis TaxID=574656 RepID=A0AAE1C318_9PEZI|nr:hypothetical protein LTR78_004021 [Recurvomyces mirabilis]KAK5153841.1 hypothetical protein LTS14_007060 [Recurvomyces mirabilis]
MAAQPHPIIAFYDPDIQAPYDGDDRNTTLEHVLKYSDTKLERKHDFIQHLFPTPEPSGFNSAATTLTKPIMDAFRERKALRDNLHRSFVRIMDFWGFTVTTDNSDHNHLDIIPQRDFLQKARQTWFSSYNHNQLRINRMIRSLRILGLEHQARYATAMFLGADLHHGNHVNDASLQIWLNSAVRGLQYPPPRPKYGGEMENQAVCSWLADADSVSEEGADGDEVLLYRHPVFVREGEADGGEVKASSHHLGPDGEVLVRLLPKTTTYGQLYAQISQPAE